MLLPGWLRGLQIAEDPLRAVYIVLTGALGPTVPASSNSKVEASLERLGSVTLAFV
jgi:2-keto-4-pentenoate hydratase